MTATEMRILNVVRGEMRARAILDAAGISYACGIGMLGKMVARGYLRRVKHGVYCRAQRKTIRIPVGPIQVAASPCEERVVRPLPLSRLMGGRG